MVYIEDGEHYVLADFRIIIPLAMFSSYHSRITVSYLKRLTNAAFGRLQAFRIYGNIGMSAPSLHRESTNSLIHVYTYQTVYSLCHGSMYIHVHVLDIQVHMVRQMLRDLGCLVMHKTWQLHRRQQCHSKFIHYQVCSTLA